MPSTTMDSTTSVSPTPTDGATPVDELAQFVGQVTQFFAAPVLLQLDWKDRAVSEYRLYRHGQQEGDAQSVASDVLSPRLPLANDSVDTILNLGSIAFLDDAALPGWLAEISRVAIRNVWITVGLTAGRDRGWWEARFFAAGFRKHPKLMEVVSYEALEDEGATLFLIFEKIPLTGLAKFPLNVLKAERDLHTDMTRESGRRSDAHIARYMLARRYLPSAGLVLDAACGLGYGSAVLAYRNPDVKVVGIDNSEFAVTYGNATFRPNYPNVEFRVGDVCDLSGFADGSVGLIVSFETVEHLREPEKFLAEVRRVLRSDGNFICSVPNMWVDEHGKDPNPWHFHVFDFTKIIDLCGKYLSIRDAFSQTAGGGMKLPKAPRRIVQVNLESQPNDTPAEWCLIAASRSPEPAVSMPSPGPTDKILVLTHNPKSPLLTSWLGQCRHEVVYETTSRIDYEFPADTGLVVSWECYQEPRATLLCKAMERGIPTLLLADGILEYRNTFEHPQIAPGAIFQPALAHKVACLGRSQARVLASWGNGAQVEVTGSARFDHYAKLQRRQRSAGEPFRVLVITALTPYFTPAHHDQVRRSLLDLKNFFATTPSIDRTPVQVEWRITKGLETEIGVSSVVTDLSGRELSEVLQRVDAVVSTPSTSMLEAMLLGLPVAALDYTNVPLYLSPAWRITAAEHIAPVVAELVNPPAPKLLYQDMALHDALECATPAAPRLVQLAEEMLARGQQARANGVPLALPPRMVPVDDEVPAVEKRFNLAELYPGHAQFLKRRLETLQVEVGQLRAYAAQLERNTEQARPSNLWRAKFEAATVLASRNHSAEAMQLMLESLKDVEITKNPELVLAALLEIGPAMGRLNLSRGRKLWEIANDLATRMQQPDSLRRVREWQAKLSGVTPPTSPLANQAA